MRYDRTLLAITLGLIAAALAAVGLSTARPAAASHAAQAAPSQAAQPTQPADGFDARDADFLADLFDGQATDMTPQETTDLLSVAHRICDLGQPRADWLDSLTIGPHAMTPDEAGKLIDTAEAAFCPAMLSQQLPTN